MRSENNRNTVVLGKQQKCDGGGGGGGETIEMWWWWWENNGNVEVLVYSLTVHEAVLRKRVHVGSMQGRYEVDVFGENV